VSKKVKLAVNFCVPGHRCSVSETIEIEDDEEYQKLTEVQKEKLHKWYFENWLESQIESGYEVVYE